MSIHPLRRIVQMFGWDIHRHRTIPARLSILSTLGINTVIDVGANVGQFAKEIRLILPQAFIHSFEPLGDCYKELCQEMRNDTLFKAYHYGLGSREGTLPIHRSTYRPSSSLLAITERNIEMLSHTHNAGDETVTLHTLDTVVKDFDFQPELLIKIDTEGYEGEVLRGAQKTLHSTRALIIENSYMVRYHGQLLFDEIYRNVQTYGFEYKGALSQKVDKQSGEVIFEDSLFVRNFS